MHKGGKNALWKEKKKVMKTFIKTICVGNYYNFCVYKITDAVGRTYYVAEAITNGVTRCSETEEELKAILERDIEPLNKFWSKVR